MNKAVILDRDGTINEDRGYIYRPEDFVFLPGVPEAVRTMREKGYAVIVITNQSGVARGFFTTDDVERLHKHMQNELQKYGARVDGVYYCPHLPNGAVKEFAAECRCRKPETGLFERAVREFDIDAGRSYAVGDRLRDILPGRKLGMRTALLSPDGATADAVDAVYADLLAFAREARPE
jgi:D-glycero-D-manno-heptose 1,7-bisphosphate phosphatase